jgi:hypothetical protein
LVILLLEIDPIPVLKCYPVFQAQEGCNGLHGENIHVLEKPCSSVSHSATTIMSSLVMNPQCIFKRCQTQSTGDAVPPFLGCSAALQQPKSKQWLPLGVGWVGDKSHKGIGRDRNVLDCDRGVDCTSTSFVKVH